MYNLEVTLRPDKPNLPLEPFYIGKETAGRIILSGVPDTASAETLVYSAPGSSAPVEVPFDDFAAWITPDTVSTEGQGRYDVYATIGGYSVWLGKGDLFVVPVTELSSATTPASPLGGGHFLPISGATGTADGKTVQLYTLMSASIEAETGNVVANTSSEVYWFDTSTGSYKEYTA